MFSPWKLYQVGQQIRCMRRGEGGMLWWKGGKANITKQYWICHCQKNTPHECFILLFGAGRDRHDHGGEPPRPWEVGSCTRWQPERTVPLNLAPGSQKEATDTFMHKCLLHTFNGCGPDGFFSPDALSMRAALRITAPAPPDGALSSISFFSASLNQWKFKNTPSGEVWIFK